MKKKVKGPAKAGVVDIRPRVRVYRGADIALGPGKVDLLRHLKTTGSLRAAAVAMGMSYMRAWSLVRLMNGCFRKPLVVATRGGKDGGGAVLTEEGRAALALYEAMDAASRKAIRPLAARVRRLLK